MTREEIIKNLKYTMKKHENDDVPTFGTNISVMCKDILDYLEQEPKTGHWIEHPEIETSAPEYLMFYECSECGDKQCFFKSDIHKKRFCSNCGCRMVEPQESEDKESEEE